MSKEIVDKIYQTRKEIIILGLTGRTGSGCSTIAQILSKDKFNDLDLPDKKTQHFDNILERQYAVIYDYMSNQDRWLPFNIIEVSSLILALILQSGKDAFINFLKQLQSERFNGNVIKISDFESVKTAINSMDSMFAKAESLEKDFSKSTPDEKEKLEELKNFYLTEIKAQKQLFKTILKSFYCRIIPNGVDKGATSKIDFYSFLFQTVGNNIRSSGECYSQELKPNKNTLLNLIDYVIRLLLKSNKLDNKPTRICIDALRNQFEIEFLRDKYKSFYAMSINVEDSIRRERLSSLSSSESSYLDKVEYPNKFDDNSKIIYHQNIQSCIEISDVHITNPPTQSGKFYGLTKQLIRYISLMLHPGLVTPTQIERCMQLAYNAKFNSGCLSRKVGSVITGDDFAIKAVGWNEVPEGQIPCNLRNVSDFIKNKDNETFSKFELESKIFGEQISKINTLTNGKLEGLNCAYCFKDIYNSIEKNKNQVHTRSLHAEENAFLQISKYGGTGIKNGKLFVTASPCELCSKKSYQLGIREIYYIDPYPGISESHILNFGEKSNPKLILFAGAIGSAYISLYSPKLSLKDEIALILETKTLSDLTNNKPAPLRYKDIVYNHITAQLNIESRMKMSLERDEKITNNLPSLNRIYKRFLWSGTNYKIKEETDNIKIEEFIADSTSYSYCIAILNPLNKGECISFKTKTIMEDHDITSLPIFSYRIENKTQKLELILNIKKSVCSGKIYFRVYADKDKTALIKNEILSQVPEDKNVGDMIVFKKKIINPNVYYTYSIEWEY